MRTMIAAAVACVLSASANAAVIGTGVSDSEGFVTVTLPEGRFRITLQGSRFEFAYVAGFYSGRKYQYFGPDYPYYEDNNVGGSVECAVGVAGGCVDEYLYPADQDYRQFIPVKVALRLNTDSARILSTIGRIPFPRPEIESVTQIYFTNVEFEGITAPGVSYTIETLNGGIPEPATWALMILGFGAVGGAMRRQRATERFASAVRGAA